MEQLNSKITIKIIQYIVQNNSPRGSTTADEINASFSIGIIVPAKEND